ncbi:MAG: T9SS type A sorting domain-containing protein [Cytophagales bacterium]
MRNSTKSYNSGTSWLISLSLVLFLPLSIFAQLTVTTVPPLNGGNGSQGTTFELSANTSILITEFGQSNAAVQNLDVWYRPGGVLATGATQPNISTAGGWTLIGTGTCPAGGTGIVNPIALPINLLIPAGQTYGFYIGGTSVIYSNPSGQTTFTDGNLVITCDASSGFGGGIPVPVNNPRQWNGSVTYIPVTGNNSIGIASLDSPQAACPGIQNAVVTVGNYGSNQVNSFDVDWELDGVAQPQINVSTLLDTLNGTGSNTTQVVLGSINLVNNQTYNIKAWTSNPNGANDTTNFDDTINVNYTSTIPTPASLLASNLGPTNADLSWIGGSGGSFQIEYGPQGFTPGSGTSVNTSNNPYALSGLTANTMYDFYVRSICGPGDTSAYAGPLSFTTTCTIFSTPYSENFDGAAWVTTFPLAIDQCWSRNPNGTAAPVWQPEDANTSSSNTGPLGDVSGTGKYIYMETSGGTAGNMADITSPLIDISSLTTPEVSFYYHMFGATMGTLDLEVNDNGTWVNLFTISGQQQAASADPWIKVSVPFTTVSDTVQFRFTGTRGTSFTGDMSVDEFRVRQAPTCPDLSNFGETNILPNSATLFWSSFGGGNNFQVEHGPAGFTQGTGTLAAATDTFVTISGLSANTNYDWYVREICTPGDSSAWSIRSDFLTPCAIFPNPYQEDFDGPGWSAVFPLTIDQCWSRTPTTGFLWQPEDANTGSFGTGPNGDVDGTGKYVYSEASFGTTGNIAELYSPLIDISNLSAPQIEFYYHMFGTNIGTLDVEVSDNGLWVNIFTLSGQQQLSETDPWTQVNVPFTTTDDTVQFRFLATRGGGLAGDISLDQFRVFQPIPEDFSAIAIDSITSGCGLSSTETMAARLVNLGTATFNTGFTFPIAASVNGVVTTETVTLSAAFAPGDTLAYTFTTPFDFSTFGSFNVSIYPQLPGDSSNVNDTISEVITNIPVISTFPYYEDFESGNGGWLASGTNSSWALGTPATTNISGASSGVNAWNTNLTGVYNANEEAYVTGPCFDFSNLTLPLIKVDVNWNSEFSWDGAQVQASTNGGTTWQPVGAFGDPDNWYTDNTVNGLAFTNQEGWTGRQSTGNGSNGWLTAENNLTTFAGNSGVLMRVAFGSDGSVQDEGFAFDNFHILESPNNDIKVDSLIGLQSGCGYTANTPISMRVTNKGILPQSNIPVFYTVNGTPSPTETIPGPINPGSTFVYNFTNNADLSVPQTYTVIGRSALATDEDTTNDASSAKIFASLFTPVVDSVANGETCESGPVTLEVFSTGDTDRWFDVPSGGTALGTGSTYTLANVTQDDTLYVESVQSTTGCNSATVSGRVPAYAFHSTTPLINFTSQVTGSLTVTFTSSLSPNVDSVLWDFGDGTFATAANPQHTFPQSQSYLITLTAYAGSCLEDTTKAVFVPVGGINDNAYTNLNVFPNPSDGSFRISAENISGEVNIEILSITGTVVYSEKAQAMGEELNHDIRLNELAQGTYILKIRNDKTLINGRIVIE